MHGLIGLDRGIPLNKRLEYEKGNIPYEGKAVTLFANLNEQCVPKGFLPQSNNCMSGLHEMDDYLVKIDDETYDLGDYSKLLKKYQIMNKEEEMYHYHNDPHRLRLTNPGVPVMIMYQKSISTTSQLTYDDIKSYTDKFQFPPVQKKYNFGDQSVSSNSILIPGIKWAYDFEHQTANTSFKVIIIIKACQIFRTL